MIRPSKAIASLAASMTWPEEPELRVSAFQPSPRVAAASSDRVKLPPLALPWTSLPRSAATNGVVRGLRDDRDGQGRRGAGGQERGGVESPPTRLSSVQIVTSALVVATIL